MAELATIARPYAQALVKASGSDLAGTAFWLDKLAAVAANPQFQQFAGDPGVTSDQVFDVIADVARTVLPGPAKNFLHTVIENGRVGALPEIAAQFRTLKNMRMGSSDAIIYSAFPLDGPELAELVSVLEKRFGRQLNAKVELESSLIGGVRVVVGDEVLDTSVKARLEQMKMALIS